MGKNFQCTRMKSGHHLQDRDDIVLEYVHWANLRFGCRILISKYPKCMCEGQWYQLLHKFTALQRFSGRLKLAMSSGL